MRISLLAAALLSFAPSSPAAPVLAERIDWPTFLARHDLVWDKLPAAWHEAAFTGNGLLGCTIYQDGGNALQWDVGRSDVTDRGNRLAIGRFAFVAADPKQKPEGTVRLDLWNAEARGTLKNGPSTVEWRSFTHTEKLAQVVEWKETPGTTPAKFVFQPLPAIPAREEFKNTPIPPEQQNPGPQTGRTGDVEWSVQSFKAGGGYVVAWCDKVLEPGRHFLVFTVDRSATGTPTSDKAVASVKSALADGPAMLTDSHRAWWHAFWPKSFLSIPDPRMEAFWWIQLYKFASGTRADRPALDLMGPWFRRTPWPKIWWNLNIQLTYWPVYASNHLDLGESLTRMLDQGAARLAANAPAEWRGDSAAIARTSSYDCAGAVGGKDGEERGNLTWTLHNYWLQYRYSGDETMLRERLYPLLKRAVGYYLHLLQPGPDGKLHIPLSLSPEYPDKAPDTNYDLALLRWGLQTLLACDQHFSLHDPLAPRWKETLDKLAPYPVDPVTGFMIGAGQPLKISHRHFSHLLMVYPLHLLDCQSAADRPLIEKSLDHWIGFQGALQGYSYTGASAMSSWLGRKDQAVSLMDQFLDRYVKANTMYLESGPVIETPLAGAAALTEVLLQSWSPDPFGTHIRVFPGVPDSWKEASFHTLRAEGAFEVSAARRDGRTRWIAVTSLSGNPCRIETGFPEPQALAAGRTFHLETKPDANGHLVTTVDLRKGETVVFIPKGSAPGPDDLVVAPVQQDPAQANPFGSKQIARSARKK